MLSERDESGDEEDRPLKLKMIKPKKRTRKKPEPEPVSVAAKGDDSEEGSEPSGDAEK